MRKNNKLIPFLVCVLIVGSCAAVLGNAKRLGLDFQPKNTENNNNFFSRMFDQSAFDDSTTGENGQAINEEAKEDTSLEEGNEELLQDKQQESETTQTLNPVIIGNGNQAENEALEDMAPRVTQDTNSSQTVQTPSIGNGTGNGTNPEAGTQNGDGTQTKPEGGTQEPQNQPTQEPQNQPTKEPERNQIHESSDDAAYGDSAKEPERVEQVVSNEVYENATRFAVICTTTGTMYLCPGEQPTSEEVSQYLSVMLSATKLDATREDISDLRYSYKNDIANYGGDFIIDWDNDVEGQNDSASVEVGEHNAMVYVYNSATGSYIAALSTISYYTIDYRVRLMDFDNQFVQTVSASGNRVVSLEEAQKAMNKELLTRTLSGDTSYTHVFKKNEEGNYINSFKGWSLSPDGESVGNYYVMSRVTEATDLYCEITLYPVWEENTAENSLYSVSLKEDGSFVVDRYQGDAESVTTLTIPEEAMEVDLKSIGEKQFPNLTVINIPAGVTNIIFPENMDAYPALIGIGVNDKNQNYMDVAGLLYDKTGRILLKVPSAVSQINTWSKYLTTIGAYALQGFQAEELTLPETVSIFQSNAFSQASIQRLLMTTNNPLQLSAYAFWEKTEEGDNFFIQELFVQDSEENRLYRNNLERLMVAINQDEISEACEKAYQLLQTLEAAQTQYQAVDGWILSADGANLLYATSLVQIEDGILLIPEGVTTLESDAFVNYGDLLELRLPESITTLMEGCFKSSSLQRVYFTGDQVPAIAKYFGEEIPQGIHLYVPDTLYNSYYGSWKRMEARVYGAGSTDRFTMPYGDSVITDEAGAVYWRPDDSAESLTLLDGSLVSGDYVLDVNTTQVKCYAFSGNTAITSIALQSGTQLISIGDYAFANCTSLEAFSTQTGTTLSMIGNHAFEGCGALSRFVWGSLDVANSLTSIGDWAFAYTAFSGLPETAEGSVNITYDEELESYDSCVIFEAKTPKTRSNLFKNLTYIGDYSFSYCSNLTRMSIPLDLAIGGYEDWNHLVKGKFDTWFTVSPTKAVGSAKSALEIEDSGGEDPGEVI